MNQWNARSQLFAKMPLRSFVTFCIAVACTFAAIGVVNDLFDLEHTDVRHLIARVVTTSGFAVLATLFIYRRMVIFRMEGRRYYVAHTEIELASRIQEQLVPPIEVKIADLEIYGVSKPSGTVGAI